MGTEEDWKELLRITERLAKSLSRSEDWLVQEALDAFKKLKERMRASAS